MKTSMVSGSRNGTRLAGRKIARSRMTRKSNTSVGRYKPRECPSSFFPTRISSEMIMAMMSQKNWFSNLPAMRQY